jgi:putative sterol carrier protein
MTPSARPNKQGHDPTAAFFEEIVSKGSEPLLHHESGTVRLDLQDGSRVEHWYVTLDRGKISVSHRSAKADGVMRTDKKLFDGMVTGNVNADAGLLRGVLEIEGEVALLSSFARLFPGPPQSRASFLERQKERAG